MHIASYSLHSAAVFLAGLHLILGHGLGIHQLQGFDPPSTPNIPEITGPFQLDLKLRFDDPAPMTFQPIFYFANETDFRTIITLFQSPAGTGFEFTVHNTFGDTKLLVPNGTIVPGEVASYSMGVRNDGLLWFQKQGGTLHLNGPSRIPDNVARPMKLLGEFDDSCCQPLRGAILDFTIRNLDEPFHPRMFELRNIPSQIKPSGFVVSFHARVDVLTGSPYIFCLSDKAPYFNHVSFQVIDTTRSAEFSIRLADSTVARLVAFDSVIVNTTSFWHLTYDPTLSTMSIDRDGVLLSSTSFLSIAPPMDVFRPNAAFGQGCAGAASGPLDGVVLGLRVDLFAVS